MYLFKIVPRRISNSWNIKKKLLIFDRVHKNFIFSNKMLPRFIGTNQIWKNVIEDCSKALRDNLRFLQIHGPTADEVTNDLTLDDKVCLITGANSGIGLEVTRCLSSRHCNVLMACRNNYEASFAAKKVCQNFDRLKFYEVNLASLDSVKNCSNSLLQTQKNIDIVILNAATFGLPWSLTENGLETTFQVNFLSQYYLLLNIERILAPNARIVITSTNSHKYVTLSDEATVHPTIDDLSLPEHKYTSIRAYNLSKLCGLLAMRYLNYRWLHTEKSVFCANPGTFVKTGLCRNYWLFEALYLSMLPFSKSITQAASTVLYGATSPDLQGQTGLYLKDLKPCVDSELARNNHLAFRLHDIACHQLREFDLDCNKFYKNNEQEQSELDELEHVVSNC